jgi:hypothetical protein
MPQRLGKVGDVKGEALEAETCVMPRGLGGMCGDGLLQPSGINFDGPRRLFCRLFPAPVCGLGMLALCVADSL